MISSSLRPRLFIPSLNRVRPFERIPGSHPGLRKAPRDENSRKYRNRTRNERRNRSAIFDFVEKQVPFIMDYLRNQCRDYFPRPKVVCIFHMMLFPISQGEHGHLRIYLDFYRMGGFADYEHLFGQLIRNHDLPWPRYRDFLAEQYYLRMKSEFSNKLRREITKQMFAVTSDLSLAELIHYWKSGVRDPRVDKLEYFLFFKIPGSQ